MLMVACLVLASFMVTFVYSVLIFPYRPILLQCSLLILGDANVLVLVMFLLTVVFSVFFNVLIIGFLVQFRAGCFFVYLVYPWLV